MWYIVIILLFVLVLGSGYLFYDYEMNKKDLSRGTYPFPTKKLTNIAPPPPEVQQNFGDSNSGILDLEYEPWITGFPLASLIDLPFQSGNIQAVADTGSSNLLVVGDSCRNCDKQHGTFPTNSPGMISSTAHKTFSYGSANFTGAFWRTTLDGKRVVVAVAQSADRCHSGGNSCNPSICGLHTGGASIIDQLSNKRKIFTLDYVNDKLRFGNDAILDSDMKYTRMKNNKNYYLADLTKIMFNGRQINKSGVNTVLIDSGTSGILGNSQAISSILGQINVGTLEFYMGDAKLTINIPSRSAASTIFQSQSGGRNKNVIILGISCMLKQILTFDNTNKRIYIK